jgi:acetylornithine/succinyldiaminopimelate/putrescine aminotransferase
VFFSNSGAEAMEAALKAVRVHGRSRGSTKVVALAKSFHGRTFGSLSITGQPDLRCMFEPFGGEVVFVEPNDIPSLNDAIDEKTAAVVLEPVLGEGGIRPLTSDFLIAAGEATHSAGAFLVADETQCGLGRTGKHFAFQWAGIQPDIVVTAKPLAAGLPLGATLLSEHAAACLPPHSHGSTFGGGPLACRVALEFLAIIDEIMPNIRQRAEQIRKGLDHLAGVFGCITEIRSAGMMFGIQLSQPGHGLVLEALRRGLLINCTQDTVIRLLPPYVFTEADAQELLLILHDVFLTLSIRGPGQLRATPGNALHRVLPTEINSPGHPASPPPSASGASEHSAMDTEEWRIDHAPQAQ